ITFFFLYFYWSHRALHSFPTRRSSDLIGTTAVRALESAALSGELRPFVGDTDIFIKPGFEFRVIDGLLTNFHLPKSTLLVLVSRSEEHTSELQSRFDLVCRLLLEKKNI